MEFGLGLELGMKLGLDSGSISIRFEGELGSGIRLGLELGLVVCPVLAFITDPEGRVRVGVRGRVRVDDSIGISIRFEGELGG
jgi:hypothetical protein